MWIIDSLSNKIFRPFAYHYVYGARSKRAFLLYLWSVWRETSLACLWKVWLKYVVKYLRSALFLTKTKMIPFIFICMPQAVLNLWALQKFANESCGRILDDNYSFGTQSQCYENCHIPQLHVSVKNINIFWCVNHFNHCNKNLTINTHVICCFFSPTRSSLAHIHRWITVERKVHWTAIVWWNGKSALVRL